MKIATIIGARPQFIKAAMVSRVLRARQGVREILIHTGQHYDNNMSDVFFEELEMPAPDYNLGIIADTQGAQTGRMLEAIEAVLITEKPDWALVYGDTNSTLAGALASVKLHIPVAHVEAGLRSFNRKMPEEHNRVLTDHCSDILFCPTKAAVENLKQEGITNTADNREFVESARLVVNVGDVMYDAALFYGSKADAHSKILIEHGLERGRFVMATVHRQENTDDTDRLRSIFQALQAVAKEMPVVLPLHPRTRKHLEGSGLLWLTEGLTLLPPVGYLDMVMLERSAAVIATDSGGVQKEAYFHGVPCVTLRDETEWEELVELRWNQLAPPKSADITSRIMNAISSKGEDARPYGNGRASEWIVDKLIAGR